ncbi:MAG: hypothetical protein A2297_01020 [Elusimicrobia bacterium RIFOXYB2_FULL_48_7]|nr:MAG: hypothetical protein A2297_01020 [Elusimicrobia bacterium RIFOXYB2_FULL_48_7]
MKLVRKILTILNSNISPFEIGYGVALGSIIGLTPFLALHNLVVFILIILLNVNISSALLAVAVFSIIGHFTDPIANLIGKLLLVKMDFLNPFWTNLYNMPIVPLTRFNNTVVLGSLVLSLVLFVPIAVLTIKFIVYYRSKLASKVAQWKIMKLFKLSPIYKIFSAYIP